MGVGLNAGGRPGQKRMAVGAGVSKRGWVILVINMPLRQKDDYYDDRPVRLDKPRWWQYGS